MTKTETPRETLKLDKALARILGEIYPPASETVPLGEAHSRVLAERLLAPLDLPPFDNSSMDGYAVRAQDVAGVRPEAPVALRLGARIAAGESAITELAAGTCARVFTGSPLPSGADAVVMQEDTRTDPKKPGVVMVQAAVEPGENVRRRGEDVRRDSVVGEVGDLLSAGRLSLLAALGQDRVVVGRQPQVGLLATGSELVEPGKPIGPGQIYESNRLALAALIRRAGGVPRFFPLTADTLDGTRAALADALDQCDVVVSSGGVSVGDLDFVKQALSEAGGSLEFWRVAIKPGRPFVFGRRGEKFLFGLPGNPVSALVTFLLLVRPALLRWQGAKETQLPAHSGVLAEPLANPGERSHFLRVRVDAAGNVTSAGLQASHALSALANANGLIEVPPRTTLPAGSSVQVLRWE